MDKSNSLSADKRLVRARAESRATLARQKQNEEEKKREAQRQMEQSAKIARWQQLIAEAGDEVLNPKEDPILADEIYKLCLKGVPPSLRGTIWPLLIGNAIKISHEEFSSLRKQADALRISAGLGTAFATRGSLSQPSSAHGSNAHEAQALLDASFESFEEGLEMEAELDSEVGAQALLENLNFSFEGIPVVAKVDNGTSESKKVKSISEEVVGANSGASNEQQHAQFVNGQIVSSDKSAELPSQCLSQVPPVVLSLSLPVQQEETNRLSDSKNLSLQSEDICIDLSKAFSYDAPTPPRQRSESYSEGGDINIFLSPAMHQSSLEGFVERLSELAAKGSSGRGDIEDDPEPNAPTGSPSRARNTAPLIKWDLPRTFPTLGFFHDGGSIQADLERILCAYTLYRPDVGYVQGMSFVAAMLLLYMDDAGAFQCMANLLSRKGTRDFFSLQSASVARYVQCFDYFFQQNLPTLFSHMHDQGLSSEMFLLDWHLTLFAKALPLDVAARVWDCYLAGGELFSMRCALGILRLYAQRLCSMSTEELMAFLTHLPQDLKAEELLASVAEIKISERKYKRFQESYTTHGGDAGGGLTDELKTKLSKVKDCTIQ